MRFQIKGMKKEQYEKYLALLPDFKKEKAQKYATIVLTLSASIILGIFAINPTLSTIANLQKQIDDSNFVMQKLQQKITNLSSLQQQYNTLQADLPIVNDAVPTATQIPLFIADVQSIAKDSSLAITGFQTLEVNTVGQASQKYSSFDFSIAAEGNYQNIIDFLNKMVNFQRVIAIKDIILSTKNGSLGLTLKGTVFFKE